MAENYTYIVKCRDGTLYTGWTNDLTNRLLAHNAGTGAKYAEPHKRLCTVFLFWKWSHTWARSGSSGSRGWVVSTQGRMAWN